MKKAVIKGTQLVGLSGNVFENGLLEENGDNKYYAVVAMCGHVGAGYYVPIMFAVEAKDTESAKKIVKNYPRVKINVSNCILAVKEISFIEARFIRLINNSDFYLTFSVKKITMENRRIMLPSFAEKIQKKYKGKRLSSFEKRMIEDSKTDSIYEIKLAKDYPEYLILQRYFAPILSGKKIVYPKRIDMDLMLRDFFVEKTKYLGVTKERPMFLTCFYKIFGADNQLGINVDDENVYFSDLNGESRSLPLDDYSRQLLEVESSTRLVDAINSKTKALQQEYDSAVGTVKTGLERFNARMQKTLQMKGKNKE